MADVRLTVNLPQEWLEALQKAAIQSHVRSAGEYVRRMIAADPAVCAATEGVDLPPMSKKWGGRQSKKD